MDAVGITASIAQLVAYGHSVAQSLLRLYQAVRAGPAAYRGQKSNISILLSIVSRVCQQNLPQEELVVPLLVDISELAYKILNILEQKGFLGLNWTLIVRREVLSEAFVSLDSKRDLLHLYISERNQHTLSQIQLDTAQLNMSFSGTNIRTLRDLSTTNTTTESTTAESSKKENKAGSNMRDPTKTVSDIFNDILTIRADRAMKLANGGAYVNAADGEVRGNGQQNWGNGHSSTYIEGERHKISDHGKSTIGDRNPSNPSVGAS